MSARTVTLLLILAFLLPVAFPATTASTGPTLNGDVVINGAFRDGTPAGHPAKPNNATTNFVAYDWVGETGAGAEGAWEVVEDGLRMARTGGAGDVVLQQYFNGSFAFSHRMEVFGASVTAYAAQPNTHLQLAIRYRDADGANKAGVKSLVLGPTPATFSFEPAELGLPAGEQSYVSVRLMTSAPNVPITIQRVSVYATNGVDARNLHVLSGGDDVLVNGGDAAFLAPGADGKYTFLVGMAADNGDFLPSLNAWVCLYAAEQVIADNGFPDNLPRPCQGAFVPHDSAAITKTRQGDAWRFDVDASAVRPPTGFSGAVALYATVEADGSFSDTNPAASKAWKTGYYNLARVAADNAGAGVSREYYVPTPIFVDGDADGVPDFVQTDELDHYAAIVTPAHARATPAATLMTPTLEGDYEFTVEVYAYPDARDAAAGAPPTGAPLALDARGIGFGIFDATLLTSGEAPDLSEDAVWLAGHGDFEQVSPTQYRVRVPASEVPGDRVVGAWAWYDVDGANTRRTAAEPAFGPSDSAFDFYSSIQTAAKEFAFADGLRSHVTPLVLESRAATSTPTVVIRKAGGDEVTHLDGVVLVDAGADGKVTFEYALVTDAGVRVPAQGGHGLAIYDAGGIASDGFAPGTSGLKHAEWVGQGVLADGWYRVDAPASAFAEAKGPVGVWAYVNDDTLTPKLSRSGWFNVLKPAVASLSTSAAEGALYPATPVVLVDRATGLPADLLAAIQAVPTLVSTQNPLVNPGFEADMLVEGARESRDPYGGTMTSPPWFLRLDDKGGTQSTTPASRHEVARGQGRNGDALAVHYSSHDAGKTLMLGQMLGVEAAQAGFAWEDATGVAFDVRNPHHAMKLRVDLHYLAGENDVRTAAVIFNVPAAEGWQRIEGVFANPVEGRLLGFYMMPYGIGASSLFLLDNVALTGSRTVLGDARTDLTDAHAVIIEPARLVNGAVNRIGGVDGDYYLFNVSVVAYEDGAAEQVDLAGNDRLSFGLRTDALVKDIGSILRLRERGDIVTAALPVADAPDSPAAPWAYARLGDAYHPLANPAYAMQPASGYYSPVKNALRGDPLADRLDYAGTPVTFGTARVADYAVNQQIELVGTPATGYGVRVTARTPFVEQTVLNVSSPSGWRTFPVTLDSATGNMVDGLTLTHAELPTLTLRTSDTTFSRGALVVAGEPVAAIEACRVDQLPACSILGVATGQPVRFTDRTVVPGGEAYARNWNFGDGAGSSAAASVDKTFAKPGEYVVNLSVTTASGKKDFTTLLVTVENRGPTAIGLDVSPATIHVDSLVTLQARASDPDGGALAYVWTVEGVEVPGATTRTLALTPDVLAATTGSPTLSRGDYDVAYTVTDGQGGSASLASAFTVADAAATASITDVQVVEAPGATYALVGETLRVVAAASDKDDGVTAVHATLLYGNLVTGAPMTQVDGAWVAEFATSEPGAHTFTVTATSATGSVESAPVTILVQADAPPTAAIDGPALVQAGETATFTANATDPDARGALTYAWLVDGVVTAFGPTLVLDDAPVGVRTVALHVTDATGQESIATAALSVDDTLSLSIEMSNVGADGLATATFLVVDEQGRPVAGATIDAKDFVGPLPEAFASATLTTDAAGRATWEIPGLGPLQIPLEHRLEAVATAPSHAAAPVLDTETDQTSVTYGAPALP